MQAAWRDRIFLTLGGRCDDSTAFGHAFSPRVTAAAALPVTDTRLPGAYGQGIKAPSFFDQFGGFGIPGNPDLKPEKSESWELGLDQPLSGDLFQAGVTYFHSDFRDLIAFVSFTVGSKNIQAARTQGVETMFPLRPIHGWRANASYTYLDTTVTDDGGVGGQNTFPQGQPLRRRPRHSGSVSVGYQQNRLSAEATLYVKGASIDRVQPARCSARESADLAVAYTLFKDVIGLRDVAWKTVFQNVLNQNYQEINGFRSARLSALTGIEVRY